MRSDRLARCRTGVPVLAVSVFAAMAWAQTPRGVISGVVVEPANNEPVRKAIVTLTLQGTPRRWATGRTDSAGEFRFEGLPPGKYDLRAAKEGVGSAIYGARSLRELGELITLREGETDAELKLLFLHPATISGRVFNPEGLPATGITVTLLRTTNKNFQRDGRTGVSGEFHIGDIPPGQYYVSASPRAPVPGESPERLIIPQFFGGSRRSKGSKVITIRGGEDLTGIDFNMTAEPPGRIHGHVIVAPNLPGAPAPRSVVSSLYELGAVTVSIAPAEDNVDEWFQASTVLPPDYDFNFDNLTPGRYRMESWSSATAASGPHRKSSMRRRAPST
jgi:hypothetical protein